jgi:tRNA pseudouridine13 synthase
MQKANRDTQDALAHISRMVKCPVKDLGVAGTKDKRGVTVQRVSLKRGKRTLEEVWKAVNNVPTRRTVANAVTVRGERGVRISDLSYRKTPLELGHLKGNSFVITLRYVMESNIQRVPKSSTQKREGVRRSD